VTDLEGSGFESWFSQQFCQFVFSDWFVQMLSLISQPHTAYTKHFCCLSVVFALGKCECHPQCCLWLEA